GCCLWLSSTQEIGEELEDGVIYSISLRKVQLHHTANKGQRWLGVNPASLSPGLSQEPQALYRVRGSSLDLNGGF
uniref:Uncharacterized protein n=1 Tax=Bubo bubo TaxID=30461 RepID=A0A8C0IC84_BUBBB